MTEIPTRNIDQVFHVGSLDVQSRTTRASLEGPCLSISLHPDEWGQIARIGGPVWELTSPGAVWFDAVNVGDDLAAEMKSWAIQEGLAEEATLWRSWFFDGESDDWSYMICDSREKAEYEADEEIDEDIGAPTDDGTAVDSLPGLRLTDAGMAHLERWSEPMDGEAGLMILYPMLVLAPQMPDLAGVWWEEYENPAALSCPRGGIFSDRLDNFEIRDPDGNAPSFREELPSP